MISMHAISGGGDAAKYFCEQNGQQAATDGRAEYYAQEDVRSSWGGSGAALAGYKIGGTVDKQDMIDVLDGKVRDITPEGYGEERQLGRTRIDENGERYVEHRSGWDFTFSSPKSVSIEAEVFDNKDARNAHEAGNTAAMGFLEKHAASARINGEHVQTGNLVIAKMEHSLSRNLDPDSHTHNLIANVTYHDGKAYSVSNEKLLDLRHTADVVAKNEEAHHLQKAGFQLEFDGKGNFEIAGYSREQIVGMSSRTEEIYSKLTEAGIDPERATFWEKKLVTAQ
ncbi:MAG: MobF family relaxase [Sulfurimicrobium sp.]|nr:MobF family relaxase [Sulfurimicrobium sp.]